MTPASQNVSAVIDNLYRTESRRIFATLVRLLGDFDLAEEALHDAFKAALEQWATQGLPDNPRAWLVSAGRFKAIDSIRRNRRFTAWDDAAEHTEALADDVLAWDEQQANDLLEDDRLRLVFTCCHPSLAADAQVALTLREVCGLTTEEIAKAFCCPHLRWRSALCGLSPKFAMPGFRTKYPIRQNLQRDWVVCCG